jgi:hypothetical protein
VYFTMGFPWASSCLLLSDLRISTETGGSALASPPAAAEEEEGAGIKQAGKNLAEAGGSGGKRGEEVSFSERNGEKRKRGRPRERKRKK